MWDLNTWLYFCR